MDIVIDVVEVINEFTDEDEDDVEAEEEEEGGREDALKQLIEAFVCPLTSLSRAYETQQQLDCELDPGVAGR